MHASSGGHVPSDVRTITSAFHKLIEIEIEKGSGDPRTVELAGDHWDKGHIALAEPMISLEDNDVRKKSLALLILRINEVAPPPLAKTNGAAALRVRPKAAGEASSPSTKKWWQFWR
jgi:hypothetical protein